MIKTDRHIKAIKIRDKYKNEIMNILKSNLNKKPKERKFPIYFENWTNRLLEIDYLIIDYKYGIKK